MANAGGIICEGDTPRNEGPLGATFPFTGSQNLVEIHTSLGAPNIEEDETIIAMAMISLINENEATRGVIPSTSNGAWTIPANSPFLERTAVTAAATEADKGDHPATVAFIKRFVEARDRVRTHLTDLITAQQCKTMNRDNIKSYYASLKIMNIRGSLILRIITPLASLVERIVGKEGLNVTKSPWMGYRMSASSTPALCRKTIDIWGTSVPGMFLEATLTKVKEAEDDPSNLDRARQIPKKMVLCAHATLNAFKQLPEDWYYGNTIKESESAMLYKGFYAAAKKLAEVGSNSAAITTATDINTLVSAIPSTLKSI